MFSMLIVTLALLAAGGFLVFLGYFAVARNAQVYPDFSLLDQNNALIFDPTFADLGTGIAAVVKDGPWVATKVGPVIYINGRMLVDISADVTAAGFSIVLPTSLSGDSGIFATQFGTGQVLNASTKALTVATPIKVGTYTVATRKVATTIDKWDGGGATTNILVDITIVALVRGFDVV